MSVRLTVVHSYSKKMLESGDNQIKKKGTSINQFVQSGMDHCIVLLRFRVWPKSAVSHLPGKKNSYTLTNMVFNTVLTPHFLHLTLLF
jgi:hypothetical protein